MKIVKNLLLIAVCSIFLISLAGCSKDENSPGTNELESVQITEFTEEEKIEIINRYTAKVSENFKGSNGFKIGFVKYENGTCEFVAFSSGSTSNSEKPNLTKYQSVDECFDFLVESHYIDKDGNILI